MSLNYALIKVVPFLNIVLSFVLLFLFLRMFSRKHHQVIYLTPWYLLFVVILIFILEEVLTILRVAYVFPRTYPYFVVNGFLEMAMVALFTYMLLKQREHIIKEGYHNK